MSGEIALPAAVKAEIARQSAARAGSVPEPLMDGEREQYLNSVEPQFHIEAQEAWDEAAAKISQQRDVWDAQMLQAIEQKLSMVITLLSPQQPQPTDAAKGWLSTEEVARYLGMTPRAVREGATAGNLPGDKYPKNSIRGTWHFKKDELDKWMKRSPRAYKRKELRTW